MAQSTKENLRKANRQLTGAHIVQSAISGLYIFFAYWAMHYFHSELVIASLGASTFITFSVPTAEPSRPRFMLGGYCIGVFSGLLCGKLVTWLPDFIYFPGYIPACALAVFTAALLMTSLNLKHPPAVALSVAITVSSNPYILSLVALCCIISLCAIKELFKRYLRNL